MWSAAAEVTAPSGAQPVVAMAGGRAFTFRYAETEELLRAAGCDVVDFDPLTDPALPPGTAGIYLGGGFPEVHAAALAGNASLVTALRTAIKSGVPTVAECAGLAYLCRTLDEVPAIGAVAAAAAMTPRLTLGYRTASSPVDSLLARRGEAVTGHEFHRTRVTPHAGQSVSADAGFAAAWELPAAPDGFATRTLHASYLHVHWAGHPQLAQRFASAAHGRAASSTSSTAPAVAMHHHGDAETGQGLVDFAVNVYAGPRPPWLNAALHRAVDDATSYPDAKVARAALAACHRRPSDEVLPTAGASEAFALVADLKKWQRPAVVHPQFTEPHADVGTGPCRTRRRRRRGQAGG